MDTSPDPADLSGLEVSAVALNRTVDALTDDDLAAPSLLPGWTQAQVVAHLALNGRSLAGVLDAVRRGEPVAMYDSDDQRDSEINELAGADPADLRDALLAATTAFSDAVAAVDEDAWSGSFNRLPGGPERRRPPFQLGRRLEVQLIAGVVVEVATHSRDVGHDVQTQVPQLFGGTDTAAEQQLR